MKIPYSRQWIDDEDLKQVENVLKSAEDDNLTPFKDLLGNLKNPYTKQKVLPQYQSPSPKTDEKYQTFCGT